jgi:hypothetical protein
LQSAKTRSTLSGFLLQHVIVFLICVAFPALVTSMAPATWITFERSGENVRCTTRTCVYFVVPLQTQQLNQVIEIGKFEQNGYSKRERIYRRTTGKKIHVDGQGFLQIYGNDDQQIEVQVSPVSLDGVISKSNAFLNSNTQASTTIFAIANWKFGALMGGILTSFTLLYVVGYTLGLLKFVFVRRRD